MSRASDGRDGSIVSVIRRPKLQNTLFPSGVNDGKSALRTHVSPTELGRHGTVVETERHSGVNTTKKSTLDADSSSASSSDYKL